MMLAEAFLLDSPTPGRGVLERDVDMARHVSWRAGGRARWFYTPADLEDLVAFLAGLPTAMPVHFVGLGSNLLVRDGGLDGVVVHLHAALDRLERVEEGNLAWGERDPAGHGVIYAEAGVASPKLARYAARHDLVGAEFLAGIPGTLGGALAMNAGCYGRETWPAVGAVLTVDRTGRLRRRSPLEYSVGYRQVVPPLGAEGECYLAAWLILPKGDGVAARDEIKRLLAQRVASQPLNQPNAGSVFRNPPGDYAARLIQACGLKGYRLGGAQVSEKHANFIVNAGGATAADIEDLIEHVAATVARETGVRLHREVRIIGRKVAVHD